MMKPQAREGATAVRESRDVSGGALSRRWRIKLLILGGTRFLGRHLTEQALAQGHTVTVMHRGRSGPGLFPRAEHRITDRDGDLAALAHGEWDSVILETAVDRLRRPGVPHVH